MLSLLALRGSFEHPSGMVIVLGQEYSPMVEHLLSMCEILGFIPAPQRQTKMAE